MVQRKTVKKGRRIKEIEICSVSQLNTRIYYCMLKLGIRGLIKKEEPGEQAAFDGLCVLRLCVLQTKVPMISREEDKTLISRYFTG